MGCKGEAAWSVLDIFLCHDVSCHLTIIVYPPPAKIMREEANSVCIGPLVLIV